MAKAHAHELANYGGVETACIHGWMAVANEHTMGDGSVRAADSAAVATSHRWQLWHRSRKTLAVLRSSNPGMVKNLLDGDSLSDKVDRQAWSG